MPQSKENKGIYVNVPNLYIIMHFSNSVVQYLMDSTIKPILGVFYVIYLPTVAVLMCLLKEVLLLDWRKIY